METGSLTYEYRHEPVMLNEVLERRQRERWSVLAQYALFDLVRTARLVWTGLLELVFGVLLGLGLAL